MDANETQGPEMNNPLNPYISLDLLAIKVEQLLPDLRQMNHRQKGGKRKVNVKKPVRSKLVFKDPSNEVPKLIIDRHKMKVVWKNIPKNANLDELERKITLENQLIDTCDLAPEDIPYRSEEKLRDVLIGIDMETIKYRKELQHKLNKNPILKEDAEKTVNWAFSGNQECYSLAERDTGFTIRELISIANGEVEVQDTEMGVVSDSRSSVPTTPDCNVIVISDSEGENSAEKKDTSNLELNCVPIRKHTALLAENTTEQTENSNVELNNDLMRDIHVY